MGSPVELVTLGNLLNPGWLSGGYHRQEDR